MGVTGLRDYLKKLAKKNHYMFEEEVNVSKYRNIKMAIDSALFLNILFHRNAKTIIKRMDPSYGGYDDEYFYSEMIKGIISSLVDIIAFFKKHNIIPIFVFEHTNDTISTAKHEEKMRRRETINKSAVKYNELLDVYNISSAELFTFDRTQGLLLEKAYIRSKRPSFDMMMSIMNFLDDIRISTVLCDCEGENFCVQLFKSGHVHAVYSKDTDCYVLGCNYIINDINIYNSTMTIVYYSRILRLMSMNSLKFRDFCIMCGTDFNHRIPMLGPAGIYKIMSDVDHYQHISQLYGSIKPRSGGYILQETDFECIQYDLCVYMFTQNDNLNANILSSNPQFENIINNQEDDIFMSDVNYDIILSSYMGDSKTINRLCKTLEDIRSFKSIYI